ncbi:MAG TPA: FAD:protein FMN transferase [Candidatus Limnocylindrales bacterium]|nr:FAD:protein FMN transferase [Candidatus Limnocylindrales bacterium]
MNVLRSISHRLGVGKATDLNRAPLAPLVFVVLLLLPAGTHGAGSANLTRFEFERPEMGMPFRMVLYAKDQNSAQAAADAAFDRIKQLNDIMSDYDPDSELSKLSAGSGQGLQVPVSADLWLVLNRAQALAARSEGAFDITVGPFVNLWRRARRQHQLPDPLRLAQARQAVGYEHLHLVPERHAVELLVPNMRLDLGGIAKGYAVDEALKTLRKHGIERALVEGGGDAAVTEPPPEKKGWRFQLSPLDATNAPSARYLLLKNAAISTSGDLYQRLEIDGKRYSHIVDPRTGIGLTDHSLVSVIAPDSMTADSLTKVVSVLGPEKGLKLIEATPGAAARVMREPGEKLEAYETSRFAKYYE